MNIQICHPNGLNLWRYLEQAPSVLRYAGNETKNRLKYVFTFLQRWMNGRLAILRPF